MNICVEHILLECMHCISSKKSPLRSSFDIIVISDKASTVLKYCCCHVLQKPKQVTYWHKFHPPILKEEQVRSIFYTHPEILYNRLTEGSFYNILCSMHEIKLHEKE